MIMIYIREAHACDVWPIGDAVSRTVKAPVSNDQRCALAHRMRTDMQMDMPFYVDQIDDAFEREFAPWPFRFYIVDRHANLCYKSQPTKELTHCPLELEVALEKVVRAAERQD